MRFCGKDAVRTTIATAPTAVLVARNNGFSPRRDLADRRSSRKCRPRAHRRVRARMRRGVRAQRRTPADVVAAGASGRSVASRDSAVDARRWRRRERALTIIIIGGMPGCAAYRDRVGEAASPRIDTAQDLIDRPNRNGGFDNNFQSNAEVAWWWPSPEEEAPDDRNPQKDVRRLSNRNKASLAVLKNHCKTWRIRKFMHCLAYGCSFFCLGGLRSITQIRIPALAAPARRQIQNRPQRSDVRRVAWILTRIGHLRRHLGRPEQSHLIAVFLEHRQCGPL